MRTARTVCFAVMALVTAAACGDEDMRPAADSNAGGAAASAGTTAQGGTPGQGGTTGTGGTDVFVPEDCGGTKPTELVAVPGGYSIDANEVTRCQYEVWLATAPSTTGQHPMCSFNESYTPACEWPTPKGKGKHPVVCVDWCDAYAYCAAIGKRLCGKIGGGPHDWGAANDASVSQWYAACSSGGVNKYPYGPEGNENNCNSIARWLWTTFEVRSDPGCQSYPGVYDLSGNVWEWTDCCASDTGRIDDCRVRGGCFSDFGGSCDAGGASDRGNDDSVVIGFRCCSP